MFVGSFLGVYPSEFQWIEFNFALLHPVCFANFCGARTYLGVLPQLLSGELGEKQLWLQIWKGKFVDKYILCTRSMEMAFDWIPPIHFRNAPRAVQSQKTISLSIIVAIKPLYNGHCNLTLQRLRNCFKWMKLFIRIALNLKCTLVWQVALGIKSLNFKLQNNLKAVAFINLCFLYHSQRKLSRSRLR